MGSIKNLYHGYFKENSQPLLKLQKIKEQNAIKNMNN